MINSIIAASNLPNCRTWTTKLIILFARSHGFTPLANYEIFKNNKCSVELSDNISSSQDAKLSIKSTCPRVDLPEEIVDILNCALGKFSLIY